MKVRELSGWASAVAGAKEVFPWVDVAIFDEAGRLEAPEKKTFVYGPNEAYMFACQTGKVRLRNGERVRS